MPISKDEFLASFRMSPEEFEQSGVSWDALVEIYEDFLDRREEYEDAAKGTADRLRRLKPVHSIRLRAKDADGVLNKIIRKYADRNLSKENYRDTVTDLAGVRALHLYREDWPEIHEFITTKWPLAERPTAFIRDGDDRTLYEERECTTEISPRGYRSVHYLIETFPTIQRQIVEVQVRTLFAEGWGEIDHGVAYPNNTMDTILEPYFRLFNRVAGLADEMATVLSIVRCQLNERAARYEKDLGDQERQKNELLAYVADLEAKSNISEAEKKELEERIASLSESSKTQQGFFTGGYALANFGSARLAMANAGITVGADRVCDRCGHRYGFGEYSCPRCGIITIGDPKQSGYVSVFAQNWPERSATETPPLAAPAASSTTRTTNTPNSRARRKKGGMTKAKSESKPREGEE